MLETNASGDSESIMCAHQLCSSPTARDEYRKPTAPVKMTRNSRFRQDAFWQKKVPDRAEKKTASRNKIEYQGKKY
eukprot:7194099-Pyramimonas_sp.AAC.1